MNSQKVYFEYLNFNNADLFTVICLPQKSGTFPTVIMRTPYVDDDEKLNEEDICKRILTDNAAWVNSGYALIFQHCRGRGKSGGDCIPYKNERADGLFLQDWVRQQPFYNGEIYLFGSSYTASVHFVTAPFADDIKGAVLRVMETGKYNGNYRNGLYKMGLHGGWYVDMYKKKSIRNKNYTPESFNMLPLSNFSKTVFGENDENLNEILKHPNKNDAFWNHDYQDGKKLGVVNNANIPILFVTAFYDIFTGGIFDMWNELDSETKAKSALAIHPFNHGCHSELEPINFADGNMDIEYLDYPVKWIDHVRKKGEPPFKPGKITYYKLFDNKWCCDDFIEPKNHQKFILGNNTISYKYDPTNPASFKGGLSTNFGGNEWQDKPNLRQDIITVYTDKFEKDTFVKGKIKAKLKVKSDCEDTCFYMRLSLCKNEGDYGLRDDINQLSNFCENYKPNSDISMDFSFDEHAFVIKKGEKLRIDISSSAFPFFVPHTNNKGLFSEQTTTKTAVNTVFLQDSYIEIPIEE
ncbi:MAG: hypothetical protein IJD45_08255 [Clostridia bacterium]|nr:hypothetical protein [Clostridia bacterium]